MSKIKALIESEQGKDILIVLIVILVGLGSFELGRLSKSDRSGDLKIEYGELYEPEASRGVVLGAEATMGSVSQSFYASSRGKKYYPALCSAGKSIVEANKVWFETREEAEAAGYELSGSCR